MARATDTRELDPGETYLVAILTPSSWTTADVVQAFSSAPPGLSPGTFQIITVEQGNVSGLLQAWHVAGKWFGPKTTVPEVSGVVLYPAVLHLEETPDEPLPVSTSTILWPPKGFDDVPDRILSPGLHYVFVILVPSTWTEDKTMALLSYLGWDLRSFSNPPSAVTSELQALYAKGFTAVPNAWLVNANWQGPDGMKLPETYSDRTNGSFNYVALAVEHPVPFGPPAPPADASGPDPWRTVLVATFWGAVVLGGLWVARHVKS